MLLERERRASRWRVWACAVAVGLAVTAAFARDALPLAPIYSKDGNLAIYAPAAKMGYRVPVLTFAARTREELERTSRLKFGAQKCPLEIAIGDKSDGDTRVLTARLRDSDGGIRERIELPDPEAADLVLFRRAVCVALLRSWMVEAGGTDETMKDVPMWLIDGVVRHMDYESRQSDLDRVLLLWSRACLPPAAELFAAESSAAKREPSLAAVLAGWFLEKRPRGQSNLFEALLRGAATGTPWTSSRASSLLAGVDDPVAFDQAFDLWLLSEGRQVVRPGITTDGIVRRFRAHLQFFPSDCGKAMNPKRATLPLREMLPLASDPDVKKNALDLAMRVKMSALGHDGTLIAVSEGYVRFLNGFAHGANLEELSRMLTDAETMRGELEKKTARGEVLRQPAGG